MVPEPDSTAGSCDMAVHPAPFDGSLLSRPKTAKNASPPTSPENHPSSRSWLDSVRRPRMSPGPRSSPFKTRSHLSNDDPRRDSGLPSTPTLDNASVMSNGTASDSVPSLPTIVVHDDSAKAKAASHSRMGSFHGLSTAIPTGSFEDLMGTDKIEFSKRGSMLINGVKATTGVERNGTISGRSVSVPTMEPVVERSSTSYEEHEEVLSEQQEPRETPEPSPEPVQEPPSPPKDQKRPPTMSSSICSDESQHLRAPQRRNVKIPGSRVLSTDEAMLSQRVRSMYEHGEEQSMRWEDGRPVSNVGFTDDSTSELGYASDSLRVDKTRQPNGQVSRAPSVAASKRSVLVKEPYEAAGGIEDWEDIEGGEVDRYGFIMQRKVTSRGSSNGSGEASAPERPQLHRVSTVLQVVSETPRRTRTIRRRPSNAISTRSAPKRMASQRSLRPPASMYSFQIASSVSLANNPWRYASNRLPHNRERRWMDEASDMLTLPPGLADIAAQEDGGRAALEMKKKEWEREEKWRKMGKVVGRNTKGGGMIFDFDTKDPKLISRTWKGIPDRWRSTAWYAFLAASAKADKSSPSDEELIDNFYELQDEDSAEDMQIDVDVPRTISSHIMFRRRYRGGQRLLFRVLHAMSLYLPDTGYVQGMAALAATLLCYYDEEKAFVMLVRLWKLRGLEHLYKSGFSGLMEALDDFEKNWLAEGEVAKKLKEHGITSTAYGTRWYLTLFNYSIPFPAQLRVWDVFMLLGDASYKIDPETPFSGDIDPLHATSAALIDATRDILLDSDFENAMKTLTSFIPVKDEDLLMRVAKAEWKQRKKRANAG